MAITDYQSLYSICNKIALSNISGIGNIGGYETYIELHTQDDIDNNWTDIQEGNYDSDNNLITKCTFGADLDESHIVLIASDNIEIPSGYTLTPINPKKSLVFLCSKFINNGTISMTAKGPNILPHDYYLIGQGDGYEEDVIVPAYANNEVPRRTAYGWDLNYGYNGNNGVNRNCGSGGHGSKYTYPGTETTTVGASGSGYAFGGGAGSGAVTYSDVGDDVDPIYPMHGGDGGHTGMYGTQSGVGNPLGKMYNNGSLTTFPQNSGVGGRIIIFCSKFENNGTISVDGVSAVYNNMPSGGASGGGAIDVFYTDLISEGTMTATGGTGASAKDPNSSLSALSGKGGDGCITLTQYNASSFILPGYANKETIGEVIRLTKLALKEKVAKDELASLILEDTYTSLTKTYSSQKIEEAILALIDDTQVASMFTNKTLSSQMIQSLIPKLVSQLENDKGYIAREISAVEVNNIWDNIFGV